MFFSLIPESLLKIYLENFENFPEEENLSEMIKINLEWNIFKKNAVHNVMASKNNNKKDLRFK
jgi:hypothetical protein